MYALYAFRRDQNSDPSILLPCMQIVLRHGLMTHDTECRIPIWLNLTIRSRNYFPIMLQHSNLLHAAPLGDEQCYGRGDSLQTFDINPFIETVHFTRDRTVHHRWHLIV